MVAAGRWRLYLLIAISAREKEGQWEQALAVLFVLDHLSMGAGRTVKTKQAMAASQDARDQPY